MNILSWFKKKPEREYEWVGEKLFDKATGVMVAEVVGFAGKWWSWSDMEQWDRQKFRTEAHAKAYAEMMIKEKLG